MKYGPFVTDDGEQRSFKTKTELITEINKIIDYKRRSKKRKAENRMFKSDFLLDVMSKHHTRLSNHHEKLTNQFGFLKFYGAKKMKLAIQLKDTTWVSFSKDDILVDLTVEYLFRKKSLDWWGECKSLIHKEMLPTNFGPTHSCWICHTEDWLDVDHISPQHKEIRDQCLKELKKSPQTCQELIDDHKKLHDRQSDSILKHIAIMYADLTSQTEFQMICRPCHKKVTKARRTRSEQEPNKKRKCKIIFNNGFFIDRTTDKL